jgi:anaphase-promoting complex subunit 1
MKIEFLQDMQATSVAPVRSTRPTVKDLLIVKPDGSLGILTHGVRQISVQPWIGSTQRTPSKMEVDGGSWSTANLKVARVEERTESCATFVMENGEKMYGSFVFSSPDILVHRCFEVLAMALPSELAFAIRLEFLHLWHEQGLFTIEDTVLVCFRRALFKILHINDPDPVSVILGWDNLSQSPLFDDLSEDVSLLGLAHPPIRKHAPADIHILKPHPLTGAALNALHHLAEDMRINLEQQILVLRIVPLICTMALVIRPEWAEYWKRLCPDITLTLPSALRRQYFFSTPE